MTRRRAALAVAEAAGYAAVVAAAWQSPAVREWASTLTGSGWWSLVTMVASVGGLVLSGHEPRWGWWWGIPAQAVWFVAGAILHRPGDLILSVIFTRLYVHNLAKNKGASYRDQRAVAEQNRALQAEVARLRAELDDCRGARALVGAV